MPALMALVKRRLVSSQSVGPSECAFVGEDFVDAQAERRGGGRWLLPGFVAAKGVDEAEDLRGDDEVRQIAGDAKQIQRKGVAFSDEPRHDGARGGNLAVRGACAGGAVHGFNERWRGCGKLQRARREEDETGGGEPVADCVESDKWLAGLMPCGCAGSG